MGHRGSREDEPEGPERPESPIIVPEKFAEDGLPPPGVYVWGASLMQSNRERLHIPSLIPFSDPIIVASVACGRQHTLIMTTDGRVFGWGDNRHSQVGVSHDTFCQTPVYIARSYFGGRRVISLACGMKHSIACVSNGKVYAWGSNKYGLSGGKHGSRPSRIPTRVRPLSFRAVSVHSCFGSMNNGALDSQGRIWLWGSNQAHQLARSNYAPSERPLLRDLFHGERCAILSVGVYHCACVMQNGDVYVWGAGRETITLNWHQHRRDHIPVKLPGKFRDVVCGEGKTMLIREDGQLCVDILQQPIHPVSPTAEVKLAACGLYHCCAVSTDNVLYGWGVINTHGECLSPHPEEVDSVVWTDVFSKVNISSVACGRSHGALVVSHR